MCVCVCVGCSLFGFIVHFQHDFTAVSQHSTTQHNTAQQNKTQDKRLYSQLDRCALAMAGLSRTKAAGSREALTLLADAINYLRDVLASPSPDAEALRGAAAAALAAMEQQLMAARAGRVA